MNMLERCPECGVRLVPFASERPRAARRAAGLTQGDMAKLLGVKASHIAYMENEQRYPSGALVLRYRKLLPRLAAEQRARLTEKMANAMRGTSKRQAN